MLSIQTIARACADGKAIVVWVHPLWLEMAEAGLAGRWWPPKRCDGGHLTHLTLPPGTYTVRGVFEEATIKDKPVDPATDGNDPRRVHGPSRCHPVDPLGVPQGWLVPGDDETKAA
jgi:hypothetical protein